MVGNEIVWGPVIRIDSAFAEDVTTGVAESSTVAEKEKSPGALGVPDISPVNGFSASDVGSEPVDFT
jgi:hypothetical protein